MKKITLFILLSMFAFAIGCTQESQNKLSRSFQKWTGANGVLDIYAGEKLVMRFVKIDTISVAPAE